MSENISSIIENWKSVIEKTETMKYCGRVIEAQGNIVKAAIPYAKIKDICLIKTLQGGTEALLKSEVVGFDKQYVLLSPYGSTDGINPGSEVIPTGSVFRIPVGPGLLGRVINCNCEPIDGKGPLKDVDHYVNLMSKPTPPMQRVPISEVLSVGVKAIDSILTIGKGQRIGMFAKAGDGKSTLMGMIARNTDAHINVISLIGERGREVLDFINESLGVEGLARSVVVVATSDEDSQSRINAAYAGTAVAEYFRSEKKDVLLMMDSVTRYARALREVGLSAGEPPARGGFPPSTFFMLPRLLERPGRDSKGSITAIYTILLDGSPIGEEVRSILDGHIVLSRDLASEGIRPAIDILDSLSRLFSELATKEQSVAATTLKKVIAKEKEIKLLVRLGEYKRGTDKDVDFALDHYKNVIDFLTQGVMEKSPFNETIKKLNRLF